MEDIMAILQDISASQVSASEYEMRQEIERLKTENAKLKSVNAGRLSLKVSDKGAISVYGMGRFPTTLYRSQMERLLDAAIIIRSFIECNADRLTTKD
jgi:hypothetical protein